MGLPDAALCRSWELDISIWDIPFAFPFSYLRLKEQPWAGLSL